MPRPLVIAHRGVTTEGPENSIAALRAVIASGAQGVEIDVRATRDGALVLWHDERVEGMLVAELSLSDLGSMPLPNGETVPTLAEGLAALDPTLMVFIETKALPPALDEAFLDVLADGPAPDRYQVHSFDHRIVRRLRTRRPELPTGVLQVAYPVRADQVLADTGASALWQEWRLIDDALITSVHGRGGRVYAWTVNDADALQRLAAMGVDGLCTDDPELARRTVDITSREDS